MDEYLRVFEFELTQDEIQEIAKKGSECLKEDLVPRVVQYYRRLRAQGQQE
jgi:hypothetical protein